MWVSWITTHRCTSHISMVLTYEVFHLNIFLIIRCVTPRPYLMVCGAAVDSVCTAVRCSCWQCLYGCAVQLLTVSVRLCGAAVDSVCIAVRCSRWQCLYGCAVQPLTVSVRLCSAAADSVCTAVRCSCWQCLYGCAVQLLTVSVRLCGAAVDSVCAVQLLTVSVRLCGAAVDSVCTAARCSCWQCLYSCAVQPLTVCADRISLCSKKGFINRRVKPHCLDQPSSAMYRYNRLTYSKDIQGKRKQKLQLPEPLKLRKV